MPLKSWKPPGVLFSLVPMSKGSLDVINDPSNQNIVKGPDPDKDDGKIPRRIDIVQDHNSRTGLTPSSLGRRGDILINRIGIANIHCSLEIHTSRNNGEDSEVLLWDQSPGQTCDFYGKTAIKPHPDLEVRCVVLDKNTNLVFGFGGLNASWYRWQIVWHMEMPVYVPDWNEDWGPISPCQAATVNNLPPTLFPKDSWSRERFLSRGVLRNGNLRHERDFLVKADAFSGQHVAVKRVKISADNSQTRLREAKLFTDLCHDHIVEFLQVQTSPQMFKIIMTLEEGNLRELVDDTPDFGSMVDVAKPGGLLHQMLQALDYLTSRNVIHHNIIPNNILYRRVNNMYHYRLAGFESSIKNGDMYHYEGDWPFCAPELVQKNDVPHTSAIDIWALCTTVIWAFRIGLFHELEVKGSGFHWLTPEMVQINARKVPLSCSVFRDMARGDPANRPSAARVLDVLFQGSGRTT
ncbi:hypothetical protein FZEAL_8794 [Fusarium zealandicum]|uniref:Protein kinase domain-containing protein n=1 Tax=Fusarium zealandicum TaxID=1053134 RepID=A0A8H4UDV5_9HYPO|nr:hypothetical protein FZEAL_8794 [Fusarium zealandicum]